MNFNVDVNFSQAVEQFPWNDQIENTILPLSIEEADKVTVEIAEDIGVASEIRPTWEVTAQRTMSLKEVCYLVVQDRGLANSVITGIQEVTPYGKTILNYVFKKLSEAFTQVGSDDLRAITLSFGIQRISEVARKMPNFSPKLTQIQQMEDFLSKLIAMRNKYDINSVPIEQRGFLEKLDTQIQIARENLAALKQSVI